MEFTMTIDMNNAEFFDGATYDVRPIDRIFEVIKKDLPHRASNAIVDINGNTIGRWELTYEGEQIPNGAYSNKGWKIIKIWREAAQEEQD